MTGQVTHQATGQVTDQVTDYGAIYRLGTAPRKGRRGNRISAGATAIYAGAKCM
jgi:hypothetical protein